MLIILLVSDIIYYIALIYYNKTTAQKKYNNFFQPRVSSNVIFACVKHFFFAAIAIIAKIVCITTAINSSESLIFEFCLRFANVRNVDMWMCFIGSSSFVSPFILSVLYRYRFRPIVQYSYKHNDELVCVVTNNAVSNFYSSMVQCSVLAYDGRKIKCHPNTTSKTTNHIIVAERLSRRQTEELSFANRQLNT